MTDTPIRDLGHDQHLATIVRLRTIEAIQKMADSHRLMAANTNRELYPGTHKLELDIAQNLERMIAVLESE